MGSDRLMHFTEAKTLLGPRNGMNIYRGCTHGCIYCDSRSTCYGFSHPFEDVEVKRNAPELLDRELSSKKRKCMVGTGSMSDPYMPCERELLLTRRCLEKVRDRGFGISLITKSDLVLRDMDILDEINRKAKAVVQMTVTTWDEDMDLRISVTGGIGAGCLRHRQTFRGPRQAQGQGDTHVGVDDPHTAVHKRHRGERLAYSGQLCRGRGERHRML